MAKKISKIDATGKFFVGQADLVIFDAVNNYETAKVSTIVSGNPKSLGDILADSTNFTGDDPTIEAIRNEQGQAFYSSVEEGSFGFEFTVASTSKEMLQALLSAEIITDTFTDSLIGSGATVAGAMHKPTVSERPIMLISDDRSSAILIPRAKIIASVTLEDKLVGISVSIQATKIDTANLKTVMFIDGKIAE